MLLPLIVLLAQTPAPSPFATAPTVAETRRLEITPKIDGKLDPEEWDELYSAGGASYYFQYEPGKYHLAAKLAGGQDLLFSLDQKSDGWLIGKDNLEVRIHLQDGQPQLMVRRLEGRKNGPEWVPASGFAASSLVSCTSDANGEVIEATIVDPGSGTIDPQPNQKPSIRLEAVPSDAKFDDAFLPRQMAQVSLVTDRGTALPDALKWGVQANTRSVTPSEGTRLRLTFNGPAEAAPKRVAMRAEGYAKDFVNTVEKPFPGFDNKKRSFVDYETQVQKDAPWGYRVLRTTLTYNSGPESVLQSSFRVAPLVDIDVTKTTITASEAPQVARIPIWIHSYSSRGVRGSYRAALSSEFSVRSGGQDAFNIPDFHGSIRRVLELIIPRVSAGTYPVQFTINVGNQSFVQTAYIAVLEKN